MTRDPFGTTSLTSLFTPFTTLASLAMFTCLACGANTDAHDDEGATVEHHDDDEEGQVHLAPEALARARIEVAPLAARVLAGDARVPAEVQLVPQRTAHVAPLSPGRLVRVDAQAGQRVKAGDVLAVVSSSEVATLAARGE